MLKPASKSEGKKLVKFEVWKAYMVAIMINCCTLERGVWHTTADISTNINISNDLDYFVDKDLLDHGIKQQKVILVNFLYVS